MKEFNIFFSWQSDLPSGQTKAFIEKVLAEVKKELQSDIIVNIDEATRNTFGSPDIVQSVFEKIEQSDLFIADVSIVGCYEIVPDDDDEEPEQNYIPNSNVMLELGFAAGTLSWDRIICLANTKYGKIDDLPFDLNHRRVTGYCFDKGTKDGERKRLTEIIKNTVIEYVGKPLPKKNYSYHVVGGYNLFGNQMADSIVPLNEFAFAKYDKNTKAKIDRVCSLIEQISNIHLEHKPKEQDVVIPEDLTISEITKDPIYSKTFEKAISFTNSVVATIDQENIEKQIKKYCDVNIPNDFFDIGDLRIGTTFAQIIGSSLIGSNEEKHKYELIEKLEAVFTELDIRYFYKEIFKDVLIIPLAIRNVSKKNDERLEIVLSVENGKGIRPTKSFFDNAYRGLEGTVHDLELVKELLHLPERPNIKFDSSLLSMADNSEVPHFISPVLDFWSKEPESTEEDYEEDLKEYVQDFDEETENVYTFSIGALRPGETLWLDRVILVKPEEMKKRIMINYSIKSENTTGNLSGTIDYVMP